MSGRWSGSDDTQAWDLDQGSSLDALVCGHRPAGSHGVACILAAGHQGEHGDWHESWPRDGQDEGELAGDAEDDPSWMGNQDAYNEAADAEDDRRGAADLHRGGLLAGLEDDDLPF